MLGETHPYAGVDHSNLALAYAEDGQYERAEDHLAAALAIIKQSPGALALVGTAAFQNFGGIYLDQGSPQQAITWLNKALQLELTNQGNTSSAISNILFQLAQAEYELGHKAKAVELARKKYELEKITIQNIFSFTSENERLAFLDMIHPMDPLISFGAAADITPLLLERKAMVIDSLTRNRNQAARNPIPVVQALLKDIRNQTHQIIHLDVELSVALEAGDLVALKAARQKLTAAELVLTDLHKQFSRLTDRALPSRDIVPAIQAALPANGVLVEYIVYDQYIGYQAAESPWQRSYGALILPADAPAQWLPLGPAPPIQKLIREYSPTRPQTDIAYEDTLNQLHEKLITPLRAQFPEDTYTLVFAPAGQLNFINFATLITPNDQFLCEQFDIRHICTGRDLLQQPLQPDPNPNPTLAVFSNPQFGDPPDAEATSREGNLNQLSFPPLPGTAKESDYLEAAAAEWKLTPKIFTGSQATESQLHSLRAPHMLHLATHGFFLRRNSKREPRESGNADWTILQPAELLRTLPGDQRLMRSGLALAGASNTLRQWQQGSIPNTRNDGILTAAEVRLLQLNHTWLTVLSACNTGVGQIQAGEGVLGLRRAFKQAGTQNLLFTLWPISDAATAGIMQDFYQDAFNDHNAPRALAEVQKNG